MEDENTVPDMTTISSDLTAVPAESYQFDGLYEYWNNQIATLFSPLLNLKTTYFVSASEQDAEKFYQLSGVEAVYEIHSEAEHETWIGDGTSASINVSVKVPKGTDFGVEQCADLPYTVSSVTEIERFRRRWNSRRTGCRRTSDLLCEKGSESAGKLLSPR